MALELSTCKEEKHNRLVLMITRRCDVSKTPFVMIKDESMVPLFYMKLTIALGNWLKECFVN